MITFEKITIEGFGSMVNKFTYNLNSPGINILSGENGAGKTTVLNGLSWGLFKKLLKPNSSITPWPQINKPSTFKGTKVEIEFKADGNNYKVIRCLDYKGKLEDGIAGKKRLLLYKDGKELPLRDKKDNNQEIVKILGYSFELFKTAVLFGQETKRLMQEDGPKKKEILEETFNILFLNKAKSAIEKESADLLLELSKLEQDIDANKNLFTALSNQLDEFERLMKTFDEDKEKAMGKLKKELKGYRRELPEKLNLKALERKSNKAKNKKESHQSEYNKKIGELTEQEFKLNFEILGIRETLEKCHQEQNNLKQELNKIPEFCSKCKQDLPKKQINKYKQGIHNALDANKDIAKKAVSNLEIKLPLYEKVVKDKLELVENSVEIFNTLKSNYNKAFDKVIKARENNFKRKSIKDNINRCNQRLDEERKKTLDIDINKPKIEMNKLTLELKDLTEKKERVHKDWSINNWLLKEPLGNSGLKAFIFEAMISKINHKLKAYEWFIGFNITLMIDLETTRKDLKIIVTKYNEPVAYEDLSGGQKQLADIVLLFAMMDSVETEKPINILLLDEVFERLSKKNIEIVAEIIKDKSTKKSIHLITHQTSFITSYNKSTHFVLKDGITTVEN